MATESTTIPRARRATAVGATAGASGVATALGVLAITGLFAPSVPFPPFQLAQAFVQAAPGALATRAIELLGHLALPLTVVGTALAFVGLGALVGIAATRLPRREWAAWTLWGSVPWLLWLAVSPSASRAAHLGSYLVAGLVGAATTAVTGSRVASRLRSLPAPEPDAPDDPTRRYLFRAGAVGAGGVLLGMSGLSRIIRPSSDPGSRPLSVSGVTSSPRRSPAPGDAGFAHIKGLTPEITPNAEFYTVDEAIVDPSIDPAGWSLSIGGLVDREGEISYDELLGMNAVQRPQTLECISNTVGGDLISTATWTGIPLRDLLGSAGADAGRAREVVFRSADGYSDSLDIEHAMDPDTLLAIGMNGRALPRAHGFPTRLLSTGTYGMKNPKWITSIEVVDSPYTGFWESRGWAKVAPVKTGARIDTPIAGREIGGGSRVTIAGVAFAGDRGVGGVEVSTDGGRSWNPARLKTALGPYTWRLWSYDWDPVEPGETFVMARATDGTGAVQTAAVAEPHPDGASGIHSVPVTVT